MKAEIKTKEKGFEPIELNITIESMDELKQLCKRLNIAGSVINEYENRYTDIETVKTSALWKMLDSLYFKLI